MGFLATWYADLSPRERRLLGGFAVVFCLVLLFLVPFGIDAMLRSRREENAALKDAIQTVQGARAQVKERQQKRDEIAKKYAKKAPKLGGFLEGLAKEEKIEIPEIQDKPEMPIGKKYAERGTILRLRKVGGLPLLKFLEKIEQSGYPVAISRLNIRKRGGEHDSFDVELGVSAYDREGATGAAGSSGTASPASSGKAGAGGAGGSTP